MVKWLGIIYIVIIALYISQSALTYGFGELIHPSTYNNADPLRFINYQSEKVSAPGHTEQASIQMFRGNIFRTGEVLETALKHFNIIKVLDPFNVGIHSAAKSTVISNESTAFVGTDSGWFYAIDKKTFKTRWSLFVPNSNRGIHSSAVIEGDNLWIGDYSGRILRIDAPSGHIIWNQFLGQAIGASPLLLGEALFVNAETSPPNGYLYKINKWTGEMIWRSQAFGEQSHSSPSTNDDQSLVFLGANNGQFYAFSTKDGSRLWQQKLTGGPLRSAPAFFKNRLYAISMEGRFHILDASSGAIVNEISISPNSRSSPALDREANRVYFSDQSKLYRIDLEGKNLIQIDLGNRFNISSPQILKSGKQTILYQVCKDQELCEIDKNLKTSRSIFKGDFKITATPHFTKGQIWIPTDQGPLFVLQEDSK